MKTTKSQLRKIRRDLLNEFWRRQEKPSGSESKGISFDWAPGGLSMVMYVDGQETLKFGSQQEVKDLISQLENLLVGSMKASP